MDIISEIILAEKLEYDMRETLGKYQTILINNFCEKHIIPTLDKLTHEGKPIYYEDQGNSFPTSAQRSFLISRSKEDIIYDKAWRLIAEPSSVTVVEYSGEKRIKRKLDLKNPEKSLEKILKEIGLKE